MPRLKGRRSSKGLSMALILGLIAISIAIPLEYFGITNLVTNFGKSAGNARTNSGNAQPIISQDTIDKVEKIDK